MGIASEKIAGENCKILDLTLAAAVTAWKPVAVPGVGVLIPLKTAAASVKNAYAKSGRYNFRIATSVTVVVGNAIYYNTATDTVQTAIPAAGFYLGVAAENGTATAGYVDVLLGEKPATGLALVFDAVDTAPTYTAAQLLGGIVIATPTAARAHTLPSAATLLAGIPAAVVGTEVRVTVMNRAADTHVLTFTASASITNGGIAAHLAVAAATSATFRIVFSNVTAGSEAAVFYRE